MRRARHLRHLGPLGSRGSSLLRLHLRAAGQTWGGEKRTCLETPRRHPESTNPPNASQHKCLLQERLFAALEPLIVNSPPFPVGKKKSTLIGHRWVTRGGNIIEWMGLWSVIITTIPYQERKGIFVSRMEGPVYKQKRWCKGGWF